MNKVRLNNVSINLDEVIGEYSKMRLETLQHAAEISPFVTERTLGPDMPIWCERKEQQSEASHYTTPKQTTSKEMSKENDESLIKETKDMENIQKSPAPPKQKRTQSSRHSIGFVEQAATSLMPSPNLLSCGQKIDFEAINSSVVMREAELQRKKTIRQQLIDKQTQQRQLEATTRRSVDHQQNERAKWLAEKRRSDSQIEQEAAEQSKKQLAESASQLEVLRKQTQRQLQAMSFQGVAKYQGKFRAKYEIVAKLLMSIDKQALLSCTDFNRQLAELIQMFDQLIAKIKSGECGRTELETAEELCKSLDTLEGSIIRELEAIVQREQQKAEAYKAEEQEAELKRQQQAQQQQQEAAVAAAAVVAEAAATAVPTAAAIDTVQQQQTVTDSPAPNDAVPSAPAAFYAKINRIYLERVEKVKPLQSDESLKMYRSTFQKAINLPVNAISAVSPEHLRDKFEKLYFLIANEQAQKPIEGSISANVKSLGRDYCILLIAKKFVGQGDSAVSSNSQAAFPLASVIVSLWRLVPEFGETFLAYVFKESPFLVPYFIPQKRGQPVEEYFKVLGYRSGNDGVEHQDIYLKRQAGIARLYAAVMISSGRQADSHAIPHPYGIEQAWRWLTNFVLLPPLPDISATLLMEVLQIVGAQLWATYGKQFSKLLVYIQHHYFPRLAAVDEGGPKARLELLLTKCIQEGNIAQPDGMLKPGFW